MVRGRDGGESDGPFPRFRGKTGTNPRRFVRDYDAIQRNCRGPEPKPSVRYGG